MNNKHIKKILPFRTAHTGAAILIVVVLLTLGSMLMTIGISRSTYEDVINTRSLLESRQSYYTAESGVEDAVYRHMKGLSIASPAVLTIGSSTATTTITNVFDEKHIDTSARYKTLTRKLSAVIRVGNGASFNFGMQSDVGGITMNNSSSVTGNAYANGPITGGGSSAIYGDVISGGPTGLINGVHATGSAWAHTIQGSTIDKNAYYQTISSTGVGGTSYPGSVDQATSSLPIGDNLIEEWKSQAASGTVITGPCPYVISADVTLGATKINCDTTVTGSNTNVILTGPVWINGNLTLQKADFHVAASLGTKSVQMIVDDPLSHATGSKISLTQATTFIDDDGGNSYVLLLSRNNSAKNSGPVTAINLSQSASGKVLVYAAEGKINLSNSVNMKEVTGYSIVLGNNTNVQYETGLANLLFSGGPGGSYIITAWSETK